MFDYQLDCSRLVPWTSRMRPVSNRYCVDFSARGAASTFVSCFASSTFTASALSTRCYFVERSRHRWGTRPPSCNFDQQIVPRLSVLYAYEMSVCIYWLSSFYATWWAIKLSHCSVFAYRLIYNDYEYQCLPFCKLSGWYHCESTWQICILLAICKLSNWNFRKLAHNWWLVTTRNTTWSLLFGSSCICMEFQW